MQYFTMEQSWVLHCVLSVVLLVLRIKKLGKIIHFVWKSQEKWILQSSRNPVKIYFLENRYQKIYLSRVTK